MDLDRLEITLRPRSSWEAIDLGFSLARRWFFVLWKLWLIGALPIVLLSVLFLGDNSTLVFLAVWWFKPLYEPPLLYWLSRGVFGERLPVKGIVRSWWRIVKPQLLLNLTLRRFSSNRSFYMPVALLENLKGRERQKRIATLGRHQQAGTWLTVVGIHFEVLLELTFLLTLYFIVPEQLRWFSWDALFFSPGPIDQWLELGSWLLAMSVIAPFYVAGGFALYLHRRSELEAWDLEIDFRRTVEHLKQRKIPQAFTALALFITVAVVTPAPSQAATLTPEDARESVQQVLEDPRFGKMEEQTHWKYVGEPEEEEETDSGWLDTLFGALFKLFEGFAVGIASVAEILLWLLVLFVVGYLLYRVGKNRDWLMSLGGRRRSNHSRPDELFGLKLAPQSLPDDVAAEALQLTKRGDLRGALSLLYRGSLVYLIDKYQLSISPSSTEGECLSLVQSRSEDSEAEYFRQLTGHWLMSAYAHRDPAATQVEQLCIGWREVYADAG